MNTKCLGLIFVFIFSFSSIGFSASLPPEGTIQRKFVRGLANAGLGSFELAYDLNRPDHGQFIPPWFIGLGKGVYHTVERSFVGVFEILTAPIPSQPILQPEFVWDYPAKQPNSF